MDFPACRRVCVGTEMDLPSRAACWPMASAAAEEPMLLWDRQRDGGQRDGQGKDTMLRIKISSLAQKFFPSCLGHVHFRRWRPTTGLLPDIRRDTSIRMLGVTLINHLSVSDHVRDVISRCAQSLHALKIMRCHGMNSDALKTVYKSVVLAKLLYASPAWWGFATSSE